MYTAAFQFSVVDILLIQILFDYEGIKVKNLFWEISFDFSIPYFSF